MKTYQAEIKSNILIKGPYYKLDFYLSDVVQDIEPGQFVNVKIPNIGESIFRRPFSIFDFDRDNKTLSIVYKVVGNGTEALSKLKAGDFCDILYPLGNGFSLPEQNEKPIIVVGGYGSAATYILAKKLRDKAVVLIGARTASDILLADEYEKIGCKVDISTEDGSIGYKGLVTELLKRYLNMPNIRIYGCGPNPMMCAIANMVSDKDIDVELSFEHPMSCGIGVCFACVLKIKSSESPEGWIYARACKEGPVFKANQIWVENYGRS